MARSQGFTRSLLEALQYIEHRLTTDPMEWGEAYRNLRDAGLVVYCGFHARIQVRYTVDNQRWIVYVTECRLLPGHPLYPPS